MAVMKNPAEVVIEKFGGHRRLAGLINVSVSRVYRWNYPKERGGTGGLIPQKHHGALLTAARAEGVSLEPVDFFPNYKRSGGRRGAGA